MLDSFSSPIIVSLTSNSFKALMDLSKFLLIAVPTNKIFGFFKFIFLYFFLKIFEIVQGITVILYSLISKFFKISFLIFSEIVIILLLFLIGNVSHMSLKKYFFIP